MSALPSPSAESPQRDSPLSWEKRDVESAQAYEAFCRYRDAGAERSLRVVGQQLGKSRALMERWSVDWDWSARSAAYDAHRERQERLAREQAHLKDIEDFRTRQRRLSTACTAAAIQLLELANSRMKALTAEDITPAMLPGFIRAAIGTAQTATNAEAEALAIEDLLARLDEQGGDT